MADRTRFKAWVTKYALSSGIFETEVEDCCDIAAGLVGAVGAANDVYRGNDWHRTLESALSHAEEMRVKKIKSLENQIAKLRTLKFGEPQ